MFWSAAMLAVGSFAFVTQARREKGTVKVGDDDLVLLVAMVAVFALSPPPLDLMYSAGIILWVLGMLLRFDRATVRYVGVHKETGEVGRGTILLTRRGPEVLTYSGPEPEVEYAD